MLQGHIMTVLKQAKARRLMGALKVATRPLSPAERTRSANDLKREKNEPKGKVVFGGALRKSIEKD